MDNSQIAHDLAIAKLYGADLSTDDTVKMYRQYYEEYLSALKSEPRQTKSAKVIKSPF